MPCICPAPWAQERSAWVQRKNCELACVRLGEEEGENLLLGLAGFAAANLGLLLSVQRL